MMAVSINDDGNAVVVWEKLTHDLKSIWVNRYLDGHGWTGEIPLENNETRNARFPKIGADAAGHFFAVWQQEDDFYSIHASQFDPLVVEH